jgi:hypothetical protein
MYLYPSHTHCVIPTPHLHPSHTHCVILTAFSHKLCHSYTPSTVHPSQTHWAYSFFTYTVSFLHPSHTHCVIPTAFSHTHTKSLLQPFYTYCIPTPIVNTRCHSYSFLTYIAFLYPSFTHCVIPAAFTHTPRLLQVSHTHCQHSFHTHTINSLNLLYTYCPTFFCTYNAKFPTHICTASIHILLSHEIPTLSFTQTNTVFRACILEGQ